jgi:hypothetical protein
MSPPRSSPPRQQQLGGAVRANAAASLFEGESQMRWNPRRDGATAVYDDTDTVDDLIIIEPTITSFAPTRAGRCDCGGPLDFRCATDGTSEICCLRCHAVLARIGLGTTVHR